MKLRNVVAILILILIAVSAHFVRGAFAQEALLSSPLAAPSSDTQLHALSSTRFHFITLKQFHAALFTPGGHDQPLSGSEVQILNAGLNTFLTSPGREELLLEALRQDKAVRLQFSVPEAEEDYEMTNHPTKPLAYRLEPKIRQVPTSIEIRPLLDQPAAFQIVLAKGDARYAYSVDWAGNISRLS
ncbi:MAG: hypothetical protein HY588_01715 [Candidatus Omnitrophica bacterium]|nr:hypothetical protein [Candidatus Omnitrophota bacterium]